jgi:vacuolar-type H+-ATPase subunit F/Vma7
MNKIQKRENSTMLVSIIGDEDTVTGMLLTGIGERNSKGETNFFKVNSSN